MSAPTIVAVQWLDESAEEAVVTISDGTNSLRCFAHPFRGKKGSPVVAPVATLDAEHVVRVTGQSEDIRAIGSGFMYEVIGVVEDTSRPVVRIGELLVELDAALPGDVKAGDWVEFVADRMDYMG